MVIRLFPPHALAKIEFGWHYRDTPFAYIDTPQIAR